MNIEWIIQTYNQVNNLFNYVMAFLLLFLSSFIFHQSLSKLNQNKLLYLQGQIQMLVQMKLKDKKKSNKALNFYLGNFSIFKKSLKFIHEILSFFYTNPFNKLKIFIIINYNKFVNLILIFRDIFLRLNYNIFNFTYKLWNLPIYYNDFKDIAINLHIQWKMEQFYCYYIFTNTSLFLSGILFFN
ncbi:unnamed protein product [Paramecium primaurelia]|uniref:Uncharacterized protein n=1 Tax=Paramecium primaurelia TaxID=5886 RepID=A0A8S1P8N1_PARPR|nr:unnamed protein product [Paramecium primaurelia]